MNMLKVSIDGGITWLESGGVRVIREEEDERAVILNVTTEGLIVDIVDESGLCIGSNSETFDQIIEDLT